MTTTIRKRNQLSGGQATRALMRRNGQLCARCGENPRANGSYCRPCANERSRQYNQSRLLPRARGPSVEGGHVINPKTTGFKCEKCGQKLERRELNAHWRQCARIRNRGE